MDSSKEPHSISLKVLRLSRPNFTQQYPFAKQDGTATIDSRAALALPTGTNDDSFILSPLLTLPPAFGSAYVGETFSCTLCANNELSSTADRTVTSIKMVAEMQTPSQSIVLDVIPNDDSASKSGIAAGESLQKIVHFELREEGAHVLAVSISYYENILSKSATSASGGRVHSFRRLYQFIAQPCLSVRTKASELQFGDGYQSRKLANFALEAQLENMADGVITLENLQFDAKSPFTATSLNWDTAEKGTDRARTPTLAPREVWQVCFLLQEDPVLSKDIPKELTKDGRYLLGILTLRWRSAMGTPGVLSTGWLTTRRI